MNLKGMAVSIVTAMLAMAVFASSAIAITVDGLESPFHEWGCGWSAGDNPRAIRVISNIMAWN